MSDNNDDQELGRVRTPRDHQLIGIVLRKMGYGRFKIYCSDEKERLGRIPGSKRRDMWIDRDNVVLVEPWDIQSDEKCNIVWRYSNAQTKWLERKGYLDELEEFL